MDRNQAADKYYFSLDYFMDFSRLMPQNARFALALYQDKVVAGTLYLHDDDNIYSYLGGADQGFQHLRPTNALIYETILWGQGMGKQRLILGGGYKPNDGISRFKGSFSPLRANFHVYKRIHMSKTYLELCNQWSAHNGQSIKQEAFFPAYRAIPFSTANTSELA